MLYCLDTSHYYALQTYFSYFRSPELAVEQMAAIVGLYNIIGKIEDSSPEWV